MLLHGTLTFRHLLVKINGLCMERVLNRICFHVQPQERAKAAASISGESCVAAQHTKNIQIKNFLNIYVAC